MTTKTPCQFNLQNGNVVCCHNDLASDPKLTQLNTHNKWRQQKLRKKTKRVINFLRGEVDRVREAWDPRLIMTCYCEQ